MTDYNPTDDELRIVADERNGPWEPGLIRDLARLVLRERRDHQGTTADRDEWRRYARECTARAEKTEASLAELAWAEMLTGQSCQRGIHGDWFVDSEHNHLCPFCERDDALRRAVPADATFVNLQAQRDSARDIAAALEAELARAEAAKQVFFDRMMLAEAALARVEALLASRNGWIFHEEFRAAIAQPPAALRLDPVPAGTADLVARATAYHPDITELRPEPIAGDEPPAAPTPPLIDLGPLACLTDPRAAGYEQIQAARRAAGSPEQGSGT